MFVSTDIRHQESRYHGLNITFLEIGMSFFFFSDYQVGTNVYAIYNSEILLFSH